MSRALLLNSFSSGVPGEAQMSPSVSSPTLYEGEEKRSRARSQGLLLSPAPRCAGLEFDQILTVGEGVGSPVQVPPLAASSPPVKSVSSVDPPALPFAVLGGFQPHLSERRSEGVSGAKQAAFRYHFYLDACLFTAKLSVYFVNGFCVNGHLYDN